MVEHPVHILVLASLYLVRSTDNSQSFLMRNFPNCHKIYFFAFIFLLNSLNFKVVWKLFFTKDTSFFYIRTSNFDEAFEYFLECSYKKKTCIQ